MFTVCFLVKEVLSIFIKKINDKFLPSEFRTLCRFPNFWEFPERLLTFVATPSRRQSIWRVDVEANERQCRVDEVFSCRHLCEAETDWHKNDKKLIGHQGWDSPELTLCHCRNLDNYNIWITKFNCLVFRCPIFKWWSEFENWTICRSYTFWPFEYHTNLEFRSPQYQYF